MIHNYDRCEKTYTNKIRVYLLHMMLYFIHTVGVSSYYEKNYNFRTNVVYAHVNFI